MDLNTDSPLLHVICTVLLLGVTTGSQELPRLQGLGEHMARLPSDFRQQFYQSVSVAVCYPTQLLRPGSHSSGSAGSAPSVGHHDRPFAASSLCLFNLAKPQPVKVSFAPPALHLSNWTKNAPSRAVWCPLKVVVTGFPPTLSVLLHYTPSPWTISSPSLPL